MTTILFMAILISLILEISLNAYNYYQKIVFFSELLCVQHFKKVKKKIVDMLT